MNETALIERITRSLAYMLRHQPEEFDLDVDSHGFADVDEVVRALNERLGEPVHESDLIDAVGSGDRERYEIQNHRIRALYGHSIPVEPGPPSKPPEILYVAIPEQDLDRARRFGLRGGRRRFLHLALSEDDARETGRRSGRDYAVLSIRALDAWEEGVNFFDRRALWLAEEIPTHLLEVVEVFHDGREPAYAREGEGRGGGNGGRRREFRDRGERSEGGGRRGRRGGRGGRERDAEREPAHAERGERGERDERGREPEREPDRGERGGRGERPERGRWGERDRGRRNERERGGRRDDRERGRDREGRGRRDERSEGERRQPERQRPADRPAAPAAPPARRKVDQPAKPSLPFGAGIVEPNAMHATEPAPLAPPSPPRPERREPARAPQMESSDSEGPSGFGAGL